MITNAATLYRITASHAHDGQTIDCNQAEVLGETHGRIYADRASAESDAEDMQDDLGDLDPSTLYEVEEVDLAVRIHSVIVESSEDDDDTGNGGNLVVDATVYLGTSLSDPQMRGDWSAKVEPGSNGEHLVPVGYSSDVLTRHGAKVADIIGCAVLESVTPEQIVDAASEAA